MEGPDMVCEDEALLALLGRLKDEGGSENRWAGETDRLAERGKGGRVFESEMDPRRSDGRLGAVELDKSGSWDEVKVEGEGREMPVIDCEVG